MYVSSYQKEKEIAISVGGQFSNGAPEISLSVDMRLSICAPADRKNLSLLFYLKEIHNICNERSFPTGEVFVRGSCLISGRMRTERKARVTLVHWMRCSHVVSRNEQAGHLALILQSSNCPMLGFAFPALYKPCERISLNDEVNF